jgi:positive regulator of sigma E activity
MINLLPVLGMIGDYLENISTSIVMYMYPILIPILAWMAGIFTALKWILIAGSFIGLLVGVVLMVWHTIRKGRKA